jgi:hypothetical protein
VAIPRQASAEKPTQKPHPPAGQWETHQSRGPRLRVGQRNAEDRGLSRVVVWQLIEQHHIQQRFVNVDAPVVLDKPEFTEAIHEEADTGSG